MACSIFLCTMASLDQDVVNELNARDNEKFTGCMCPKDVNTTGTLREYCGHELKPNDGHKSFCEPEGIYKCINGLPEASLEHNCTQMKTTKVCKKLQSCPKCGKFILKSCKK